MKPANVSVYVKLSSVRVPPRIEGVQFGFDAPQVCPNPNWTPSIRPGTLTLDSFTYTLTFAGFTSPYITITG